MISKSPNRPKKNNQSTNRITISPNLLDTPERVLEFCRQQGFPATSYVDIAAVIEACPELVLVYKDLGTNDAYIKRIGDDSFEIGVNSKHHPNRQRYSMAHEFAHYILHRSKIDSLPDGEQILHRNGERNDMERQANQLAAEILMPASLFETALANADRKIKEVANILQVSQEALTYRLPSLGYAKL